MIQATELRIGNLVTYKGNYPFDGTFNEEFAGYMFSVNDEWDFLEPIPLTEQWLLKFGFEKQGNNYFKSGVTLTIDLWEKKFKYDVFNNEMKHLIIESVHKLQNLFFVLSAGKELIIKELVT